MIEYLRHVGVTSASKKLVEVRCECGFVFITREDSVKEKRTLSCGCLKKRRMRQLGLDSATHHRTKTVEYVAWQHMLQRCLGNRTTGYKYWGGRGITVCDKWRFSFTEFFKDVGPRPGNGFSLDRIDVNGNYEPGNVRWATLSEQSRNRRPFKRRKICLS